MIESSLSPGDTEAIAAFLDRRLSESERGAFLERLDREPVLYEVFVDTVRYRESEPQRGEVVEHPSKRGAWLIPSTIAAMLTIAVVGPFLLREARFRSGAGWVRGLVEQGGLEAALGTDWYEQGWRRTRGLTPLRSEVDSAFRVGVHVVDLEVALRLERRQDAERLLRYIDAELGNVDSGDPVRRSYGELLRRLEQGATPERLLERMESTEPRALELPVGYGFAFGKWAETGKLAARTGHKEILRSHPFREVLDRIRERDWTDVVDQRLEEIHTVITAPDRPLDLEALEEAFTAIIDES